MASFSWKSNTNMATQYGPLKLALELEMQQQPELTYRLNIISRLL